LRVVEGFQVDAPHLGAQHGTGGNNIDHIVSRVAPDRAFHHRPPQPCRSTARPTIVLIDALSIDARLLGSLS
jgi:hypothetical protein